MRLDCARYHPNPDGTELRDTPHIHYFVEGSELAWAKPVTWYNVAEPMTTLETFLGEIHGLFPHGYQSTLL